MNKKVLFKETQRFTQWWIWLPLLLLVSYAFYGISKQLLTGVTFGEHPLSNLGVMGLGLLLLVVLALFWYMRLETIITENGVYVQLFPFHLRKRYIAWERVQQCYVRQYKPLREFGGWGIRYGFAGKAYNVAGNEGLQLVYGSNEKLLIGTQKSEELEEVLKLFALYKPYTF
ncbi:MAG TPA: hypothetical protein VK175_11350 [Leadbetterella sp.]|nr:hypothetical protein [Leadbetterella sp.]